MKKVLAVDTETTGLKFWSDKIFGLSVSYNNVDKYWDIRVNDQCALKRKLLDAMNKADVIVFHNAKFDIHFLREWGVSVPFPKVEDTMIRAALIDEHRFSYDLDSLGKDIVGMGKVGNIYVDLADMFGGNPTRNAQMKNLHKAPPELVAPYAKRDTRITLNLWNAQESEILSQDLGRVHQLEKDVLPVLVDMEKKGVRVDIDQAEKAVKECTKEIVLAEVRLNELAGFKVNPNPSGSIHQLFEPKQDKHGNWVLIDGTMAGKTGTGKASINADVLRAMKHPAASLILDIRKTKKMRDTFLLGHILGHHDNNIIHANFNQTKGDNDAGTGTGRLSINSPALQQIPKRDKRIASKVRSIFLPDQGQEWNCVDGNTEYLTHTGWKKIKNFKEGEKIACAYPDLHDPTGAKVVYEEPTKYIKVKADSDWFNIKNMSVSKDHGIPGYRFRNGKHNFSLRPPQEMVNLTKSRRFTIPQVWTEQRKGMCFFDEEIQLMVAVIADGHFRKNRKVENECVVVLKKDRKKCRLELLLSKCGIQFRKWNSNTRKEYVTFIFNAPFVDKLYGNKMWWDASIAQRKLVLAECTLWDGSKFNSGDKVCKKFYSNSKSSIDFIQWCAHSTAKRAEVVESKVGQFSLALSMKTKKGFAVRDIKTANPPNNMYCFKTTSSFWVARKQRSIFLTSNCRDWSQMDFRIFAHYLGDDTITRQYMDDPESDFHQIAGDITGLPRSPRYSGEPNAKQINLGLVFGMGSGTMAEKMGLPYTWEKFTINEKSKIPGKAPKKRIIRYKKPGVEAKAVFDKYHSAIPGVEFLLSRASSVAKTRGYVKTAMGRRLRFPGGQYTHKAGGLIFQGTAADALKIKMVEIHNLLKGTEGRLLLNVHDEFDSSLPSNSGLNSKISKIMHGFGPDDVIHLNIPIRSTNGKGGNWWEAC